MNASPIVKAVEAELAHYPGVQMEFHNRGKHDRLVFHRGQSSRFLTIPRTPSDHRAGANAMRDLRKTMRELGAQRLAPGASRGKRGPRSRFASLAMNERIVILHIPAASPLLGRFRTKEGRPAAHWSFSLRPSVDLTAPPLLVVKQVEVPAGQKVKAGVVAGFDAGGAWRLTMSRTMVPALDQRVEVLPTTKLALYEETTEQLVFKLPTGTLPTGFTRPEQAEVGDHQDDGQDKPLTALEVATEAYRHHAPPAPAPAAAPAPQSVALLNEQPITLQMPKPGVSIEAAIGVLNKAKQRLGNNLRFTIEEGGYLSAVHRIGK